MKQTLKRHVVGLIGGALLGGALVAGVVNALAGASATPTAASTPAAPAGFGPGHFGGMAGYPRATGTESASLGPRMMAGGPSAMMGGMNGQAGAMVGAMLAGHASQVVAPDRARTLGDQVPSGATIDQQANRLTFTTSDIRLVVIASPPYGRDMTFRIAGLTDPTVVVPKGARVTVEFINGDQDSGHGWMVTRASAPLPYLPMLASGPAFAGAFAHPLGDPTLGGWPAETISFEASASGQFTYLCPLPGHGQQGMTGQFVVE